MAWGSTGSGFTDSSKASSATTWTMWASAACAVGDYLILIIASDNITTTDGNTNDHQSVSTGDGGVTWTKLYEFTNGQGTAGGGATVSIWLSTQCNATTVDATTVTFSAAVLAKACTLKQFQIASGSTISSVGTPQTVANDAADPGSLTLGGLTSGEYLWIRGIAGETNTDTGLTVTTNWTAFSYSASSSTTGGGTAANMAVAGEYRILTGTTATSDPTWQNMDNASILVALKENVAASGPLIIPSRRRIMLHYAGR